MEEIGARLPEGVLHMLGLARSNEPGLEERKPVLP